MSQTKHLSFAQELQPRKGAGLSRWAFPVAKTNFPRKESMEWPKKKNPFAKA